MANLYTQEQNLNYILFYVEYCGRLFRVPINSKEFETRIKQVHVMHAFVADDTLRLEFVKKVQAKIAENDPKFLSFEIIRKEEATKLKLVPSTSGSNRALSPMPKAAQANNHVDKKRSAIPRNNLAPVNEEINGQSNSGAAAVAGTSGAGVQRWTFDEVSTLLECYAIYEPSFFQEVGKNSHFVGKEMEKRGVKTTAEGYSVKFAAMKKRFNELNYQNLDGEKGRRVQ
uniref:Uncharacterized protein n=1 Tax=Daphnia galeata TaxID=27404 RepID=A0A8J2VZX0_9CRUS|nr:unnamed protein product [Daphnia galeata]